MGRSLTATTARLAMSACRCTTLSPWQEGQPCCSSSNPKRNLSEKAARALPGSLQPLMGSVLSADSSVVSGWLLSTCLEEVTQWWWEDTTGGQPGPEDDQQEPDDDSHVERLGEQGDTEENRDGWIDVGDNGATAGSHLGHQREKDQIGHRRADHAEHKEARYHLQAGYLAGESGHRQRQHDDGRADTLDRYYSQAGEGSDGRSLYEQGTGSVARSGQQDQSCPEQPLRISAHVETQQGHRASHANQQSDQAKATHPLTWIEREREEHNEQWISGDEQAGERRRDMLFAEA